MPLTDRDRAHERAVAGWPTDMRGAYDAFRATLEKCEHDDERGGCLHEDDPSAPDANGYGCSLCRGPRGTGYADGVSEARRREAFAAGWTAAMKSVGAAGDRAGGTLVVKTR